MDFAIKPVKKKKKRPAVFDSVNQLIISSKWIKTLSHTFFHPSPNSLTHKTHHEWTLKTAEGRKPLWQFCIRNTVVVLFVVQFCVCMTNDIPLNSGSCKWSLSSTLNNNWHQDLQEFSQPFPTSDTPLTAFDKKFCLHPGPVPFISAVHVPETVFLSDGFASQHFFLPPVLLKGSLANTALCHMLNENLIQMRDYFHRFGDSACSGYVQHTPSFQSA